MHKSAITVLALMAGTAVGCGDDGGSSGDGNLELILVAEDTIPEGIPSDPSGEEDEAIVDGYRAEFDRYIIAVGLVDMAQAGGANQQQSSVVSVADYANLPTTDPTLVNFNGIPTGQYSEFGFETPVIDDDPDVNVNVADEDVQRMIDNDYTYIIEGRVIPDGGGDAIEFLIEAVVPSVYTDCDGNVAPGVAVGPSSTASILMHGDHIFFNGFPADESDVERRAAWMSRVVDRDENGVLEKADFEAAVDLGTLFPESEGYVGLNDGPVGTLTNAWDFIRSQLGTQGHINGEFECEWGDI